MRDIGQGRIGGQAQRLRSTGVAHVVGTERTRGAGPAIVERRPHPDLDAGHARHRLDAPEDLRRIEDALKALEAGREIGDADLVAGAVANGGLQNRGVAQIGRLRDHCVLDLDVAETLVFVARQQPGKQRVGIEAGEAPPHDPAVPVE